MCGSRGQCRTLSGDSDAAWVSWVQMYIAENFFKDGMCFEKNCIFKNLKIL